jgi:hypothetical protein
MYRFPRLHRVARAAFPQKLKRVLQGAIGFDVWYDLTQTSVELERAVALFARSAERVRRRNPDELTTLGEKYGTSKLTVGYLEHYWMHFGPIRSSVRKLLEIGVDDGASLRMWEEFFPQATIIGIDIDERCRAFEGGRRRVFIGNQRDESFLRSIIEETGGDFDIVIDDGEHSDLAVLKSFAWLFPAMTDHGIYAIEDLIGLHRALKFFRELEVHLNYWPPGIPTSKWPEVSSFAGELPWLTRNITGIHFHRYLCLINRGFNPEDNPYLLR